MASLLGLKHFFKSDGTELLLAAYGNDIGRFNGAQVFMGQGLNLAGVDVEMDVFLDYLVTANGSNTNLVYDGTAWFRGGMRTRMPRSHYVKTVGNRLYLADLSYASTNFRSRIWYSNLPKNNDIQWGFETGTNLKQTSGSKTVSVSTPTTGFITYGIKTGDPFFITNGDNAGEYTVDTVDSEYQITLFEEMKNTATGSTFWVGSNFVDTRTNDSDYIRGLGENDNKLLIFKRESLHTYDEKQLRQVKDVPGTTSQRSVVNLRENTYYFHDSGVYRFDGTVSYLISRPIQDWIDGVSSSRYENVVAWVDGDIVYFYVGNITNTARGIDISRGVLIYDTATQAWNLGSFGHEITCGAVAIESSARQIYLGTSTDEVLTWDSGNADISTPISWEAGTVFHFPAQPYSVIEFDRCEIHVLDGRGISVYYKIYGKDKIDTNWKPLGDIVDDVTELVFRRGTFGRGIAYKFLEISSRRPPIVERIDTYYKDREMRNLPTTTNL